MVSRNERGFALAAAIMVLALLSVLGAAAIQSTTLEVKISARDRDARAALYVAEATLEEARYYAARGWGKIVPTGIPGEVVVETVTPTPAGFTWGGNRYRGFTLVDQEGDTFTIAGHDGDPPPDVEITVSGGTPVAGRFFILRRNFTGTVTGSQLDVVDAEWASVTTSDDWNGWLLWNADGDSYMVSDSGSNLATDTVWLRFSTDPGPGPFTLTLNPWLAALAAGNVSLPEDFDSGTTDRWDRQFDDPDNPGEVLGQGYAEVVRTTSGAYRDTYRLSAVGSTGQSTRTVSLRIYRAGSPDQRVADWVIE